MTPTREPDSHPAPPPVQPGQHAPPHTPASDERRATTYPTGLIERLYVYWVGSTVILLVALLAAAVYLRGAVSGQAQRISQLAERVQALESQVSATSGSVSAASVAIPPAAPSTAEHPLPADAASVGRPQATQQVAQSRSASEKDEAWIRRLLDRALRPGRRLPAVVAEVSAAEAAVKVASELADPGACDAKTWEQLAILARLLGRENLADELARRAMHAGSPAAAYAETSARLLLAAGHPQEALRHAQHLARQTAGTPAARLLLARALNSLRAYAAADELLSWIDDPSVLPPPQRLELARTCADLAQWERFALIMDSLTSAPAGFENEWNFLRAVSQIQRRRNLAEALAALDYLAGRVAAAPAGDADGEVPPDAYEVGVWRAAAFLRGNQPKLAREVLEVLVAVQPDRPEAHYWLALSALHEDMPETARAHLKDTLTASEYFIPAWETLASVEINSGDLPAATQAAQRAIALNSRRPSAHFLLAIAQAKAGRRDSAAEALRATFRLDPAYLNKAFETEILTRLFTAAELRSFAAEVGAEPEGPRPGLPASPAPPASTLPSQPASTMQPYAFTATPQARASASPFLSRP
jgi:tetratricopeptide (TPR) repeat protein/outer membrane murein-binding lipoprotein Lpp